MVAENGYGYFHNLAIGVDQLVNCLLLGAADETLSARAYRKAVHSKNWNRVRKFIDLLFFWQEEHCCQAYIAELDRKQAGRY